jgi:hypothetical protein
VDTHALLGVTGIVAIVCLVGLLTNGGGLKLTIKRFGFSLIVFPRIKAMEEDEPKAKRLPGSRGNKKNGNETEQGTGMRQTPDPKLVRKVTVVTEDVLGPMQNTLYLDLDDGSSVCLWKKREMKKFVAELEKVRPEIGGSIRAALARVGDIAGEQVFNLDAD